VLAELFALQLDPPMHLGKRKSTTKDTPDGLMVYYWRCHSCKKGNCPARVCFSPSLMYFWAVKAHIGPMTVPKRLMTGGVGGTHPASTNAAVNAMYPFSYELSVAPSNKTGRWPTPGKGERELANTANQYLHADADVPTAKQIESMITTRKRRLDAKAEEPAANFAQVERYLEERFATLEKFLEAGNHGAVLISVGLHAAVKFFAPAKVTL
jgi:hypothetical protein